MVEDEEHLRQVCTEVLIRFGYKVLLASNGKEALALSEGHSGQIDLLLTDVVMPEMNGLELAETLLASRPGLKVVFISGFPRGMLSHDGGVKPGTVLVAKPFTIKVLMSKLREVLDA
ncbi:MAG TPA: response regulator [Alphaproteobacteria bacterium]|nr:response regulator [Alphaproteobacteria bacterium]